MVIGLNVDGSYQELTRTTQYTTANHLHDANTASRYTMPRPTRTITVDVIAGAFHRLQTRVDIDPRTNCVNWTGALRSGYAALNVNGHLYSGHRIIAVMFGLMPADSPLYIDHTCMNKRCINPQHLEPVTHAENNKRAWERGEYQTTGFGLVNKKKTHCPRGHEYTPENTYTGPNAATRSCRTCRTAQKHADYLRKKAARQVANNENNNKKEGKQ
jgi:hypothetical protein